MKSGFTTGVVAVLLFGAALAGRAEDTNWVEESNANAAPLLDVLARYAPETAAAYGVEGHDTEVLDLKPGYDTRFEADLAGVAGEHESKLAAASDPRVRQDLQILLSAARTSARPRSSTAA